MRTLLVLLICLACSAPSRAATATLNTSNGHYYQLVTIKGGITYYGARERARRSTFHGMRGHLASVTSAEEQAFLVKTFPDCAYHWLGGFRAGAFWYWKTREPWGYTAWASGEPTTYDNANGVQLGPSGGAWVARVRTLPAPGYIIEYERKIRPKPVFVDRFNSGRIDTRLWRLVINGSGVTAGVKNGRFEITFPPTAHGGTFGAPLLSAWQPRGDFDFQVDYELLDWPVGNGVRVGLGAGVYGVNRINRGSLDGEPYDAVGADFADGHSRFVPNSDRRGKFRLVRAGPTLYSYDFHNGYWRLLYSYNVGTRDLEWVALSTWTHDYAFAKKQVKIAFDNFRVNSGTLVESPAVKPAITAGGKTGKIKINPKDGAEMILIPAGTFLMGSTDAQVAKVLRENTFLKAEWIDCEKPQHKVYLDSYYIYKNLVTVAQYREFCKATSGKTPSAPGGERIDDQPVVDVTWEDANAYAKWAGGSLPTEAQWEKAARGTDGRIYPWGNTRYPDKFVNSVGDNSPFPTAPVGSLPSGASPYGVLDMAGSVWQWCADRYDGAYYAHSPSRNPTGPGPGQFGLRVARGGGWGYGSARLVRAADRSGIDPTVRYGGVGFRCVKTSDRGAIRDSDTPKTAKVSEGSRQLAIEKQGQDTYLVSGKDRLQILRDSRWIPSSGRDLQAKLPGGYLVSTDRVGFVDVIRKNKPVDSISMDNLCDQWVKDDRFWGGHEAANYMRYLQNRKPFKTFVTNLVPVGNSALGVWDWRYMGASGGEQGIAAQCLVRIMVTPKPRVDILRSLELREAWADNDYGYAGPGNRLFMFAGKVIILDKNQVEVCDPTTGKAVETLSLE